MLLHVRPRLLLPRSFEKGELLDLTIEPLGLRLRGGAELATRRPYVNKRYFVGCRRKGQKAIGGILIETRRHVSEFLYTARWAINAATLVTHTVAYKVIDDDFDAASDSMVLWYGSGPELGGWSNRWPENLKGIPPVKAEPKMEIEPRPEVSRIVDTLDRDGCVVRRHEEFSMPTIERKRITDRVIDDEKLPSLDSAFHVDA